MQGGYLNIGPPQLRQLPTRVINPADPVDLALYNRMLSLVEQMIDLHRNLTASHIPDDKKLYQRQVAATDAQIDKLVYELYGLTKKEIRIVEEATT